MKTFNLCVGLAALAFANISSAEPYSACTPTAIDLRTDFPASAQDQRRHGSVTVGIFLNDQGEVARARVASSSGNAVLDQAALASARRNWRFDSSKCAAADKTREFIVAVKFEQSRGIAVSGTLNRKSVQRILELEASDRCQSTRQSNDATVFVCRSSGSERLADVESQSK